MISIKRLEMDEKQTEIGDPYIFFWRPKDTYGELSQWYDSPFIINDNSFGTAEQFMMWSKASLCGDETMANRILNSIESHPADHKRMGRLVRNFNESVWTNASLHVVVVGNLCKFTQNVKLKNILMNTNEKMLVEASPSDRVWGIGFAHEIALSNRSEWGQNKLGRALMIVRMMIVQMDEYSESFTNTSQLSEMCERMDVGEFDPSGVFNTSTD